MGYVSLLRGLRVVQTRDWRVGIGRRTGVSWEGKECNWVGIGIMYLICQVRVGGMRGPCEGITKCGKWDYAACKWDSVPDLKVREPGLKVDIHEFKVSIYGLKVRFVRSCRLLPFDDIYAVHSTIHPSRQSNEIIYFRSPYDDLSDRTRETGRFSPADSLMPVHRISKYST